MKDIFIGICLAIAFIAKVIFRLVHIFFSSLYQNAAEINEELKHELAELRERKDSHEF